jgi:Uma2 family endonuclease
MLVEVLEPSVLRMPELSDDAFFDFCVSNEEHRIERTAEGRIVIMPGTGARTGARNNRLSARLLDWSDAHGKGVAFDSNTMFILPNSAMRAADAAWVSLERIRTVASDQRDKFLPLCPEFVVEITSPSDRIRQVQAKMEEWIANGALLGWILEADKRRVHVYRAGEKTEVFDNLIEISGSGPVPGFTLNLKKIWDPGW